MTLDERIEAFDRLGRVFERYFGSEILNSGTEKDPALFRNILDNAIREAGILNPWFTRENVLTALSAMSRILNRNGLTAWIGQRDHASLEPAIPSITGVIMAGNIPLAGFHDFLTVLITGNKFLGKLSSRDDRLLPAIAKLISLINEELGRNALFTEDKLSGIDAIIATGSNNTHRYFDYYFGKYPHIFRKNRNSIAILKGDETPAQINALGADIFTYFGLGCRSVSKIFIPADYNLNKLFEALEIFSPVNGHNKYMNNYQYYRSVYLLNRIPHSDNGFLLLKEDENYNSPVGVVYYQYYSSLDQLVQKLKKDRDQLQCIVAGEITGLPIVQFGKSQLPELWDYADNINTMDFLINLAEKSRL